MSTPHELDHESFPHEPLEGSIPGNGIMHGTPSSHMHSGWSRRMEWLLASRILGEKPDHWLG